METLFGMVGDGFAIVVSDRSQQRSIVTFKHDEDKMVPLDDYKVLAATGENADRIAFTEFIQRNMALDKFRTGLDKTSRATAHFIRRELATALRRSPFNVNLLLAGYDRIAPAEGASLMVASSTGGEGAAESKETEDAPSGTASAAAAPSTEGGGRANLYWMDYLGTLQRVNYGAHGYCAYFVSSTMDRHWKPGMSQEEALALVRTCLGVLHKRFLVHQPRFLVRIVSEKGTETIEMTTPQTTDAPRTKEEIGVA